MQKDRLDAARARHAPRGLIRPDLPLIVSAGFHIGRLVPPFGTRGHVTDADGFAADEDGLFVSSGFLRAYVQHHRGQHIYTLKRIARRAPTVIVPPPPVYAGINHEAFIDTIIGLMLAGGLTVYDPRDDFAHLGHTLPPDYLAADGVHGNARYGSGGDRRDVVAGNDPAQGRLKRPAKGGATMRSLVIGATGGIGGAVTARLGDRGEVLTLSRRDGLE